MKKNLLLALTYLALASQSYAQEFTLTAEINARSEFRNGFKKPILDGQSNAFFTEQRSRLYANYKEEKFEIQLTLQDIRFWGATGQVYKSDQSMTHVSEAWARYKFSSDFSFKAGRQIISYDNQRFFGGLEWAMQGRRHDALLFMYETDSKLKIHAGFAYNQNPSDGQEPVRLVGTNYSQINITGHPAGAYHATGNYKHLEYLWLNKKFESGSALSAYLVNDARQDYDISTSTFGSTNARQTIGLMGTVKASDNITIKAEAFFQGGEVAGGKELSANMFSVSGTLKTDLTPITIGYDRLSGTDYDETEKSTSFAPAFGTNHAFYGFMDYFYVGNPHKGGLQDIYLKTKFKFGEKGGALLGHVHYFMSAAKVLETVSDGSTPVDADGALGTEIDLVYVKKLAKAVTWKLGFSTMIEGDGMKAVKSIDQTASTGPNYWGWTQIIFKPQLFKSKEEPKS